jgi:signal peptidase I
MTMFKPLFSQLWSRFGADVRFFGTAAAVFVAFQTAAYGMYYIPSESMLPTLAVGDRVVVNKFAYGYSRHSLPFSIGPDWPTHDGRVLSKSPERGDVVVFTHPKTGKVMIKRVIGLPGDEVRLVDGRLLLNGALAEAQFTELRRYKEHRGGAVSVERFSERIPDGATHEIYDRGRGFFGDDFGPLRVPEDMLFVMGDNRDNSLDSRFGGEGVGLLSVDRLIGRAELMAFSLNMCRPSPGLECLNRKWGQRL